MLHSLLLPPEVRKLESLREFLSRALVVDAFRATFTVGAKFIGFTLDGVGVPSIDANGISGNWSAYSAARYFIIDTKGPSVPVLSSPANGSSISGNTPTLDWGNSSGNPTRYTVQVGNYPNYFDSPKWTSSPTASTATTSVLADGVYFWRVKARDAAGNWSAYSAIRSFTIKSD